MAGPEMGVKLAVVGKGLLGRLWLLLFSGVFAGLLAMIVTVLVVLLTGDALSGSGRWTLTVAFFFLALLGSLAYHFLVYPEVDVFDRGLRVRTPLGGVCVPWGDVVRVQERPGRVHLVTRAPLTPVSRWVALAVRQPGHACLISRRAGGYTVARRILRDKLRTGGRFS